MKTRTTKKGFSLTEVLMAMAVFSIAVIFIAGVFPVAIRFTRVTSEKINSAAAADEAMAKIRLYGSSDANWISLMRMAECNDFNNIRTWTEWEYFRLDEKDYRYPSVAQAQGVERYYWSALCRLVGPNDIQLTIFVSRAGDPAARYYQRDKVGTIFNPLYNNFVYPRLVAVEVRRQAAFYRDEIEILDADGTDGIDENSFINSGDTIVCDSDGVQYRVLERYGNAGQLLKLDNDWLGLTEPKSDFVWVIPGPVGPGGCKGKSPCVNVSQPVTVRF